MWFGGLSDEVTKGGLSRWCGGGERGGGVGFCDDRGAVEGRVVEKLRMYLLRVCVCIEQAGGVLEEGSVK